MRYSFNDICKMITGTDANNICTPEKESDWLSIAKHIMAGFSIITNMPEWVKRPADALLICDSTLDKFTEKYADTSLEALYSFVTEESANDYLLDDEEDEDSGTVKGCISRQNVSRNTLMNRAYVHFAKAIAKAYICQNAERDGRRSVGKFLDENRLETFGQFLYKKKAFGDFVQIED